MYVVKRGPRGREEVKFDKIVTRIRYLCNGLHPLIDPIKVALETIQNLKDGISTEELDRISAKIAESYKLIHPDYGKLAGRICVSNLHKTTPDKFSECMKKVYESRKNNSQEHFQFIQDHAQELDNMIIRDNDYNLDYLGFKTLEGSYLYKINDRICDRPQYMFMRVAIAIYKDLKDKSEALEQIKICYKGLSQGFFIHATPTLFNACSHNQQLLSCFLLGTEDSIEGIMKTITDASMISKRAGGIGIWQHCIRSKGAKIHGTDGKSSGLCKQLKIYNETARCWDQGGKRLGAFAIYLEPWHGDILDFLKLKLNNGAETERARDLFYALWIPDLFIQRVKTNEDWTLFSEDTTPFLSDVYDGMNVCSKCGRIETIEELCYWKDGKKLFNLNSNTDEGDGGYDLDEFDAHQRKCRSPLNGNYEHTYEKRNVFSDLYQQYEADKKVFNKKIKARDVLDAICTAWRESGTPFICHKDHVNRKSNQKNIGTIKSSNLCTEIMEYSSADSYASCCLASINVKKFLVRTVDEGWKVDHEKLHEIVRLVTRNLDRILNVNQYPVMECVRNALELRPIGIGIQGLADLFCQMRISFLSKEAEKIDLEIMETIYHAALEESTELARIEGQYLDFDGSPASNGLLQFDLWQEDLKNRNVNLGNSNVLSGRYDWDGLKTKIKKQGLRNSLLIALMPTVSTSQILGNAAESFEPYCSNIYTKTTLTGKTMVANTLMISHLIELGIWSEDLKNKIINNNGSLQGLEEIPVGVQEIYKTVYELSQKELMRRAALRGAFVDQAQSLNIYVKDSSDKVLRGILLTGHEYGLKTGSYYIRTLPAASVLKNNISVSRPKTPRNNKENSEDQDESSAVSSPRSFSLYNET